MVNPTPLRQRQTGFRLPLGEWFNDIIDRVNGLVAGTLTGSWAGTFTAGASSRIGWAGVSQIYGGAANGNIVLSDAAATDFGLLQFGGTTSSFPAWKRSGADLQARLADDSAFTGIQASQLNFANASRIYDTGDGVFRLSNSAVTVTTDITLSGASSTGTSTATFGGGIKTTGATFALQTATTLTDNAAAQVATMTNGPTAGNPTKWIAINDNGVTRYLPCW